jgi:hypothetical protein
MPPPSTRRAKYHVPTQNVAMVILRWSENSEWTIFGHHGSFRDASTRRRRARHTGEEEEERTMPFAQWSSALSARREGGICLKDLANHVAGCHACVHTPITTQHSPRHAPRSYCTLADFHHRSQKRLSIGTPRTIASQFSFVDTNYSIHQENKRTCA